MARTGTRRMAGIPGFGIDRVAGTAGEDPAVLRLENLDTDLVPPDEALRATLVFVDDGNDHVPRRGPEVTPFSPPDGFAPFSLRPTVQQLAAGTVEAWPAGPVTVALGRAVLGPGARVVPAADEMMLFAVEAGTLGIAGDEDLLLGSGAGMAQPAGSPREVRNAGDGLLILLLVTVAPLAE